MKRIIKKNYKTIDKIKKGVYNELTSLWLFVLKKRRRIIWVKILKKHFQNRRIKQ